MRRLICAFALDACLSSCGDREHDEPRPPPPPSRLEVTIVRELATRLGEPPTVHCATVYGMPRGCTATLADGTKLPIRVREVGKQVRWQVDGLVVMAPPIEAYVRGVLADLGAAQAVDCGARIHHVPPGDRVTCGLAGGGKAFATIAADGSLALELALDPAAAAARTDAVKDLEARSKALQHTEDADEDEGAPSDAGVESRP